MGLERKSRQILKVDYYVSGSSICINSHTFLDCVLAEMSNPNSKLAVFFKELDRIARKYGKTNFEKISKEAKKCLSEINKSIQTSKLAFEMIKDTTGSDMSYKIDLENDIIILTMADRIYTFAPSQFNLDTVISSLIQNLNCVKSEIANCIESKRSLSRDLAKFKSARLFPKKYSKTYSTKQKQYDEVSTSLSKLEKERETLEVICDLDKSGLTLYEVFIAIFNEYANRRALRYLNKRSSAYINGSYNVEDIEKALDKKEEAFTSVIYDAPNEVFPVVEEKGINDEYGFSMLIPEDIEKLRSLVEWFIDNIYDKDYNKELNNNVSRKRKKSNN